MGWQTCLTCLTCQMCLTKVRYAMAMTCHWLKQSDTLMLLVSWWFQSKWLPQSLNFEDLWGLRDRLSGCWSPRCQRCRWWLFSQDPDSADMCSPQRKATCSHQLIWKRDKESTHFSIFSVSNHLAVPESVSKPHKDSTTSRLVWHGSLSFSAESLPCRQNFTKSCQILMQDLLLHDWCFRCPDFMDSVWFRASTLERENVAPELCCDRRYTWHRQDPPQIQIFSE